MPVVIPTIVNLVVVEIIIAAKGKRLGLIFPIIGNLISLGSLAYILLGPVILFNLSSWCLYGYVIAFFILVTGFTYIEAFRNDQLLFLSHSKAGNHILGFFVSLLSLFRIPFYVELL